MTNALFKKPLKKKTRKSLIGYSFILIWIIGFAFFTLYPFIMALAYSLSDVTITSTNIILKSLSRSKYLTKCDNSYIRS